MELRRRGTSERIALAHGMVAGRLPACDLQVDDPSVSRQHARFERDGESWTVVDLKSSNGVFRNGQRVARAALRGGDLLTLGSVAFDLLEAPRTLDAAPRAAAGARAAAEEIPVLGVGGAVESAAAAELERARLRADLSDRRRSRGLGDISQQPAWLRWTIYAGGAGLMYAIVQAVRLLAGGV